MEKTFFEIYGSGCINCIYQSEDGINWNLFSKCVECMTNSEFQEYKLKIEEEQKLIKRQTANQKLLNLGFTQEEIDVLFNV